LKYLSIILLNLIAVSLQGQTFRNAVSARWLGLPAYSQFQNDVFSFSANSAAIAGLTDFTAGVFGENRFLSEINLFKASMAFPSVHGNFGVQVDYFGFEQYNESQIGFSYARDLGTKVAVGATFNYYNARVSAISSNSTVTFNAGIIWQPAEKITAGLSASNPIGGYLSKSGNEKLPFSYQLGMGYEPSRQILLSAIMEYAENLPLNVTAAFVFKYENKFFARGGMQSLNTSPFASAGIAFDKFRIDLSVSHHPYLGLSPGVTIIYQNKK